MLAQIPTLLEVVRVYFMGSRDPKPGAGTEKSRSQNDSDAGENPRPPLLQPPLTPGLPDMMSASEERRRVMKKRT